MMRQFTIELRVDYGNGNEDLTKLMRQAVRVAGRHLYGQAGLLPSPTGQKPLIAMFSDDFYEGHEDMALMEDELGKAIAADDTPETHVSEEMLAMARDNGKS